MATKQYLKLRSSGLRAREPVQEIGGLELTRDTFFERKGPRPYTYNLERRVHFP